MEAYLVDWLNLLARWVHLVTGVAWIGASFYFVWLDNHLQPPREARDSERGVGGEIWSVHGGGFYHAQKYRVAPPELPERLHWFKWEAYWTWMSGIFLLALLYWYGAEIYLIDPAVAQLSKPVAIGIGMGTIVVGWLVYDGLCRSPLGKNDLHLGVAVFGFTVAVAFGLCQVFSGRGAFIHYGGMLGTIMVANVLMVIIPGQKEMVTAKAQGREPDPRFGLQGKQRSVHNTYFTLPVLFVMISNHFAGTYAHSYNWLVLVALSLGGALVRVWFVARHFGKASPAPLVAGVAMLLVVIVAMAPPLDGTSAMSGSTNKANAGPAASFVQVQGIVIARCTGCHATTPTYPGFAVAPKGVILETPEQMAAQAAQIHQQAVVTQAMPIGNLTGITAEERAILAGWFESGESIQ